MISRLQDIEEEFVDNFESARQHLSLIKARHNIASKAFKEFNELQSKIEANY